MSGSRKTDAPAPEVAFDAWRVMGSGAQALQPLVKSASKVNLEIAGYASGRARAWVETSAALMRCRTPQDLIETQMGFWREAGREWLEANQRISGIWQTALADAARTDGKDVRRDYITFAGDADVTAEPAQNGHAPRRAAAERRAAA